MRGSNVLPAWRDARRADTLPRHAVVGEVSLSFVFLPWPVWGRGGIPSPRGGVIRTQVHVITSATCLMQSCQQTPPASPKSDFQHQNGPSRRCIWKVPIGRCPTAPVLFSHGPAWQTHGKLLRARGGAVLLMVGHSFGTPRKPSCTTNRAYLPLFP